MSPTSYMPVMFEIRETDRFKTWLKNLKDRRAVIKIVARIRRIELGNLGDVKPVGENVSEMRIHYGPGYRIYFTRQGNRIIILLSAGTKKTQTQDIKAAMKMANEIKE